VSRKQNSIIPKAAAIAAIGFTAISCFAGIGGFGASLNAQLVGKLGFIRFPAVAMAAWLIYILNTRKNQLFQWAYAAATIVFAGAALSTIQPGAFGSVSTAIVTGIPGPTDGFKALIVWFITAALFIAPNTKDLKLVGVKEMFGSCKPEISQKFKIPILAAGPITAGAIAAPNGLLPIPVAHFTDLLLDKAFMRNRNLIPIGVKEDGRPLYVELGDKYPQFLVAGMTGSGKTVFEQALIVSFAAKNTPADLQMILIDGVQRGFKPLSILPHVIHDGVLYEEYAVVNALEYVYVSLKERIRDDVRAPKILTFIDDIDDFFAGDKGKDIQKMTTFIVKKGRQFGVHMIIGSQRPSGDLISPHTLAMLKRVCLQVELPKYSENIIEKPDGAALKGEGDLLFLDSGQLIHARGFYLDETKRHEITSIAAQIAGMYPPARRILGAGAADGEDAGAAGYDAVEGEYPEPDDGFDLYIPDKNRVGDPDRVCMYGSKIIPLGGVKSDVWGCMDGHTAIHTAPHTDGHTDHTTTVADVSDDDIIEMVNGGAVYRDTAKILNVSLWRVQETMRKYKERQADAVL